MEFHPKRNEFHKFNYLYSTVIATLHYNVRYICVTCISDTYNLRTMSKNYYITDHLFPRTNYLIGAGSIFNIAGNYFEFNRSSSAEEADAKAIESDWGTIGKDIVETAQANPKETLTPCK